jgi:hypothetical protein
MIPSSQVFADPDVDLEFRKNGYVVLPILNESEIHSLLELWDRLAIAVPADFFLSINSDDRRLRRLVADNILEVLAPHVAPIIPGHQPMSGCFAVKRGNSSKGEVGLHQDATFVDQTIYTAVHLWCPLVDVDEHNGCLRLIAGSHAFVDHIAGLPWSPSPWDTVRELLCSDCSTTVPLKAGSALFYNERTLHWSAENQSDGTRLAIASAYIPTNSHARFHLWDPANPNRFELMELEGQLTVDLGSANGYRPPYPEDWRHIGFMDYEFEPLTPHQIEPLMVRRPVAVATEPPQHRGWLARLRLR